MQNFESVKQLLDNSSTFYLISVGMDSTYSYLNPLYKSIFESQHGDLIGQNYAVTMHENDTDICAEVSQKCFISPEEIFPATIRKHDGQGGYIVTQWDYKAMFDPKGEPSGIFCIGYDITAFIHKTTALEQMEHIQSHVIRKPIANLLGLVGLLDEQPLEKEGRSILQMVKQAVAELDRFIRKEKHEGS